MEFLKCFYFHICIELNRGHPIYWLNNAYADLCDLLRPSSDVPMNQRISSCIPNIRSRGEKEMANGSNEGRCQDWLPFQLFDRPA